MRRLASRLAGAHIDKSSRFTDWARRPLTERQVKYALEDVTYLRRVYEKLAARLAATERAHWLDEEMAALTDPATYRLDPAAAWQRLKVRSNNRRMLALVRDARRMARGDGAAAQPAAQPRRARRAAARNRRARAQDRRRARAHARPRQGLRRKPLRRRDFGRHREDVRAAGGGLSRAGAAPRRCRRGWGRSSICCACC